MPQKKFLLPHTEASIAHIFSVTKRKAALKSSMYAGIV